MIIDLAFLIIIIVALFKGISRGFIVAVFSLVAYIIGLAAALKLSAVVAAHLHEKMNVSGYWLPVLSFLIVFIAVVIAVRWGAAIIKKVVSFAFMGWLDSLLGFLLYAVLYLMIFSVVLFFATRIHLISAETQSVSRTYSYVAPFGPKVISSIGKVIPFFSNMFSDLSKFFSAVSIKD